MTEVVCAKPQEDYEDDFEKDLDWLIGEESRGEDHGPDFDDLEAEIDKELEEEEDKRKGNKRKPKSRKENRGKKTPELEGDEERWPSPMEPLEYDPDTDGPIKPSPTVPPPDDQTDEEKKYILEKIQQANRDLRDQEAPDKARRRRLHFKETLVDLAVSPRQGGNSPEAGRLQGNRDSEAEVSGKLSELKLSSRVEEGVRPGKARGDGEGGVKEGRVLVEKDGKFDLVSLKEVESQGLLPPLARDHSSQRHQQPTGSPSPSQRGVDPPRAPKPPAQPRDRPSSASHSQGGNRGRGSKRRVQSASGAPCQTTYSLSPQQKDLLHRIHQKKEKLAREEEQRKREEEETKRRENELAFKAWLLRKREQLQGEKRIQRAQEMEKMSSKKDGSDSEDSFRLWLQRKREQQQRERQLLELRRMEEEGGELLRSRAQCERAFDTWLKRKRAEKRAQQRAARECARMLVLEERRARRLRDLLCSANESRPFRFTEALNYRF